MVRTIYLDLRSFQQRYNALQGLAHHLLAVLDARQDSALATWNTIGLVAPHLPDVPTEIKSCVDDFTSSTNPICGSGITLFIDPSPMTENPREVIRFGSHSRFLRVGIAHQDYLHIHEPVTASIATRIDHVAKLARLRSFDLILPSSQDTAEQLIERLRIPPTRIVVTGAATRDMSDKDMFLTSRTGSIGPSSEVGRIFWNAIDRAVENRISFAGKPRRPKPRVAYLTPYPPDDCTGALYTAITMRSSRAIIESDLYTDAPASNTDHHIQHVGPVTIAPLVAGEYDAVISVLGNSSYYDSIFSVAERYGGPCILHDVRLTHSYYRRLGRAGFLQFAGTLLGRCVSNEEVTLWLSDANPPSLFVEYLLRRAFPVIVQTPTQQALLKKHCTIDAYITTCCPTTLIEEQELNVPTKHAIRGRCGISVTTFLVSCFAEDTHTSFVNSYLFALELLRAWGIPAFFYFTGYSQVEQIKINEVAELYSVADYIYCVVDDETAYRNVLISADAALVLGTYSFGTPSRALMDCIGACLPCVTTNDRAQAVDAPEYVITVPDLFSALHIAEQLKTTWQRFTHPTRHLDQRRRYLLTHNFDYYVQRLIEILQIA